MKPDREPAAALTKNQHDPAKIFRWPSDHVVYQYDPADFVGVGEIVPAGPHGGKVKLGNGKFGDQVPVQKPE